MNFIITGLNEKYWNPWGISWISSLKELSQTSCKIIVMDFGLNNITEKKLNEMGVSVQKENNSSNIRNATLSSIINLSKTLDGNIAYFDADCWFQENIDHVFDLIEDKMLIANNNNPGFLAGSHKSWQKFDTVNKITSLMKDENKVECMVKYFSSDVKLINDKFNCINLPDLKENNGLLSLQEQVQSVIHPTGILKKLALRKNLMFYERYPDIFKSYEISNKIKLSRKLFIN